jgi:Bacterial TSP3 repeat/Pectate lyase
MKMFSRLSVALIGLALLTNPVMAQSPSAFVNPDDGNIPDRSSHPIAFPSAMGFGKIASVRDPNAVVYKINSLLDVADPNDNLITFRECAVGLAVNKPYVIPANKPRYCVFDVAGQIVVNSEIRPASPKLYIAGQTSPGGIEVRIGQAYNPVNTPLHIQRTNNVILRHMRFRLGEHPDRLSKNGDSIRISESSGVIADHISAQYGTDGSFDFGCTENCTMQWVMMGPNVCRNAGHHSSSHCKTGLLAGKNLTIAHNISELGVFRGMNVAPGTAPVVSGSRAQVDIVNNFIYNYTEEFGLLTNERSHVYANYIGNTAFRGPTFKAGTNLNYFIGLYTKTEQAASLVHGFDVYAKDNITFRRRLAGQFGQTTTDPFRKDAGMISKTLPGSVCSINKSTGQKDCSISGVNVVQELTPAIAPGNQGLSVLQSHITTPEMAVRGLLNHAGADLCRDGPCRDNVDTKFIEDLRTCDVSPKILENMVWPSKAVDIAGWGQYTQGPVKVDTDNDGMPDEWERQFNNTNPNVWDANADADGDGYTNIEEYLNSLAKDDVRYANFIGNQQGTLPKYNCGYNLTP